MAYRRRRARQDQKARQQHGDGGNRVRSDLQNRQRRRAVPGAEELDHPRDPGDQRGGSGMIVIYRRSQQASGLQ